jgi:small subunit ribosomal protein S1
VKEFVGESQDKDTSLMWQYLDQEEYDYQRPQKGEIREGIVLRKDQNEVVLDIGVKLDAVATSQDLDKLEQDEFAEISVGDTIPVYILNPDDVDGRVLVSINMAKSQEDWDEAERLMESGEIIEAPVTGHNKGGLIVPFGRLRGFVPASQVMGLVQRTESGNRLDRLEQMVGNALKMKVIEVNQRRRRLIMSERAAMREWRAENKQRLLDELQPSDVRKGVVTNLMNFGAFVDLGGADGLVHVSEMAWHRVKHPRDVLEVGQEVEVYVLSIDREEERIALSMKRLQSDPWSQVTEKYSVGDDVEAEVTNLAEFGAFARLEPGVEGLIHISELSEEMVEHPREVVHRGQRLTLRIISIDSERQRIGLSLKRVPQPRVEEETAEDDYAEPQAEYRNGQAPDADEPATTEEPAYYEEALADEEPVEPVSEVSEQGLDEEPVEPVSEVGEQGLDEELGEPVSEVSEQGPDERGTW